MRKRDLENSLTAYSLLNWSTARWTAPKEPRPISCLMVYWFILWTAAPSSSLEPCCVRALSVSCVLHVRIICDRAISNAKRYLDGGCPRGGSLVVSYGALVCRQGPAQSDGCSVRLNQVKGLCVHCKALHVFDSSRSAMTGICTG